MRIRTRRTDQHKQFTEHPVRGLKRARDGYMDFDAKAPRVDPLSGAVVIETTIGTDRPVIMVLDFDDDEFEQILRHRMTYRPGPTQAAIGRALLDDAEHRESTSSLEPTRSIGIDRSRQHDPLGWLMGQVSASARDS